MAPLRDLELHSFLEAEDSPREMLPKPRSAALRRLSARAALILALAAAAIVAFAAWPSSPAPPATAAPGTAADAIGEWGFQLPKPSADGAGAAPDPRAAAPPAAAAPSGAAAAKPGPAVAAAVTAVPAVPAIAAAPRPLTLAELLKGVAAKNVAAVTLSLAKAAYSQATAKAFAALAKLSYCGPLPGLFASASYSCSAIQLAGVKSVCEDAAFYVTPGLVRPVSSADLGETDSLFAYMARVEPSGNTSSFQSGVVIVLRGSIDNLANSRRDKLTLMSDGVDGCKDCGVHEGYHKSYHRLEEQITRTLAELNCQPNSAPLPAGVQACRVYVTGHGSGAAMASLAAWELSNQNYTIGTSYIFESPQMGNKKWAELMTKRFSGEQGPIFSVTNGKDSATLWPFNESFTPWGVEAHYEGLTATAPKQICWSGEASCGVAQYASSELTSKDMCESPLAPENDFCKLKAFVPQCYGGVGFQFTNLFPKLPIWEQPAASAAATWHPSQQDGTQAEAVANDTEPTHYFSPAVLKCVAALAKLSYCGPESGGLPNSVQASLTGGSGLGQECGFGVVPHSVHLATSNYQSDPTKIFVDKPLFAYTALVRRSTAKFAQAPFFVTSEACVVAFRGTMNDQNRALNSMTSLVPLNDTACPKCAVYKGIYNAWTAADGLGSQVVSALKATGCVPHPGKTTVKKVFCVGHSMGGAFCTLAVYMLHKLGFQVELSWSLEGWMPGNPEFMDYVNNKMLAELRPVPFWHVTHARDAVARFPASIHSNGTAGRCRFQAYFNGQGWPALGQAPLGKPTLCTSMADYGKDSKCGLFQVPRPQLVWLSSGVTSDHCDLPFAPHGQMCMLLGPASQCSWGGSITGPF